MEDIGNALLGQEEVEETETPVVETPAIAEPAAEEAPVVETPAPAAVEAPAPTPAPSLSSKEAGILADLQEERRGRQQLQAELDALKAAKVEDEKPVLDGRDDDDLITVAEARKAIPAMAKQAARLAIQEQQVADSEAEAKAKFPDFDEVLKEGSRNLLPGDREAIRLAGRNSAQLARQLCIDRTPALKAKDDDARIAALLASKQTPQTKQTPPPNKAPATSAKPTAATHRQALSMADTLLGHGEEVDE
jgi:hypothetical protein